MVQFYKARSQNHENAVSVRAFNVELHAAEDVVQSFAESLDVLVQACRPDIEFSFQANAASAAVSNLAPVDRDAIVHVHCAEKPRIPAAREAKLVF